jgi:hypothetical protein
MQERWMTNCVLFFAIILASAATATNSVARTWRCESAAVTGFASQSGPTQMRFNSNASYVITVPVLPDTLFAGNLQIAAAQNSPNILLGGLRKITGVDADIYGNLVFPCTALDLSSIGQVGMRLNCEILLSDSFVFLTATGLYSMVSHGYEQGNSQSYVEVGTCRLID